MLLCNKHCKLLNLIGILSTIARPMGVLSPNHTFLNRRIREANLKSPKANLLQKK